MAIEAIELIGFLVILFIGDLITKRLWGTGEIVDGLTFKQLFDIGDALLIACFTIRGCFRLFGIMKES